MSSGRITQLTDGKITSRDDRYDAPTGTGMRCSICGGSVELHEIPRPMPRRVYRCRRCGGTKLVSTSKDEVTIEMGE